MLAPKEIALITCIVIAAPVAAADRDYDFSEFSNVEVAEGVEVTISTGDFHVEANARVGNINRLIIEQHGDTLHIERRRGLLPSIRADRFEVMISMPELANLSASSGSEVTGDVALSDLFSADAVSGSSIRLTGTDTRGAELHAGSGAALSFSGNTEELALDLGSGASMALTGSCTDLEVEAGSGATLSAGNMECETADISAGSGASIRVYASDTASIEARSGSSVRLTGNPSIESIETGSGASVTVN